MKTIVFLVLMTGAVCISLTLATVPGFKIRLSKKGLDYANTVAHDTLAKELKDLKIPDQSGHDGHMDWSLTGIQNRGCTIPGSSMTFAPSKNGLTWAMSNFGINLHADWRVKYKKGWFKVSTSGSVDANIKRVSLQVTIRLVQSGGRPSISMAECHASVGDVDVDFHGGTAFILNLFKHVIERKIKDMMQDQICKLVGKEVNVDANAKLKTLKVNVEMDHRFLLNYGLVSPPSVHTGNLETQHKGEVFWKGDVKEAPFSPKPIPPLADETRMMYLWVTDYVANSFAYTAQQHKFLQYNVTENDFPPANRSYLNTTCKLLCIGKLIPQIGKKYPNSVVEARVVSLQAPVVNITAKDITLSADVNTDLYAHTPDKKVPFLITLRIKMSVSVQGAIVKERLTGKITGHHIKFNVVKSAIGNVNPSVLNLIVNGALDLAIVPKINSIMKQGVDLPVTGVVLFQNTKLVLLNGSLLITTDIHAKQLSDLTVTSERLL